MGGSSNKDDAVEEMPADPEGAQAADPEGAQPESSSAQSHQVAIPDPPAPETMFMPAIPAYKPVAEIAQMCGPLAVCCRC
jgi:hypothetical protein